MVACVTYEREIVCNGLASVLLGNDVVELKRQWIEGLRHLTVFAAGVRSGSNQIGERLIHASSRYQPFKATRAFDCKIAK